MERLVNDIVIGREYDFTGESGLVLVDLAHHHRLFVKDQLQSSVAECPAIVSSGKLYRIAICMLFSSKIGLCLAQRWGLSR